MKVSSHIRNLIRKVKICDLGFEVFKQEHIAWSDLSVYYSKLYFLTQVADLAFTRHEDLFFLCNQAKIPGVAIKENLCYQAKIFFFYDLIPAAYIFKPHVNISISGTSRISIEVNNIIIMLIIKLRFTWWIDSMPELVWI